MYIYIYIYILTTTITTKSIYLRVFFYLPNPHQQIFGSIIIDPLKKKKSEAANELLYKLQYHKSLDYNRIKKKKNCFTFCPMDAAFLLRGLFLIFGLN